ncbi:hypothetical protein [Rhodospirillum sp. A1_3_36]|uniref:hypothetical protein n=1 Tax=Rhodospirillum sp. A1_3_36 TaxID=3391666 RepID=UPI0039A6167F
MAVTPTSYHAFNLFTLTMATRFGANWRRDMAPETVAAHADEIALGFGGLMEDTDHTQSGGAAQKRWRFPDGSIACTGAFGLGMEGNSEGRSEPFQAVG